MGWGKEAAPTLQSRGGSSGLPGGSQGVHTLSEPPERMDERVLTRVRVEAACPVGPCEWGCGGGGTRGCGTPAPLCQVEGDSEGTRGEGLQCVVPGDGVSVSFLGKWNGVPSADGTHVLPNRRKFQMASQHDVACHQALTEMPASGDILHHCWELIYHLPPSPNLWRRSTCDPPTLPRREARVGEAGEYPAWTRWTRR